VNPAGQAPRDGLGTALRVLQRALRAEAHLHRELERRAVLVRDAVLQRDVPALREASAAQREALAALERVAAQVQAVLGSAGALLGLPGTPGLCGLAAALRGRGLPAEAEAIEALRADVIAAAGRARRASGECAPLLRQALAFTNFVLSLLVATGQGAPYTADGHAGVARRALLDARG
jgi:hypothetical protein